MVFPLTKLSRSSKIYNSIKNSSLTNNAFQFSTHVDEKRLKSIRNIGILAHIDAGKTTTTERMLFYSGKISCMGEVHHGNTVTDYMEQERDRGITITSASVSYMWKDHQINLVDTPGHIDFTMEVENALSVIDGCVVILDSSAGVEAQTQTVWRQADQKNVPRIVYANKMDRQDSSLRLCVDTLQNKFGAEVFVTQLPIRKKGSDFIGVVDLLHLNKLSWEESDGKLAVAPLQEATDGLLWEEATQAREELIDKLSSFDDLLAENIIASESLESVSATALSAALRRATILCKGVPLLCGSSYKNKGVEPLMDAIVRYLPSPLECSNQTLLRGFENNLCAHAFKVVHHNYLGPLVFFRLFSGELTKNQKVFNLRLQIPEKCTNIMVATADDFEEVESVSVGNIAVAAGLIETRAGDKITSSASAAKKACENIAARGKITEEEAKALLGVGALPPESVFFCSIEAPSLSHQVALDKALIKLQREDPSLSVTYDEETSQVILGGMGELHLDIIKERLQTEYKLDVLLGPIQIAYREALQTLVEEKIRIEETIGSSKQLVELDVQIEPKEQGKKGDFLRIYSPDSEIQQKLEKITSNRKIMQALRNGVKEGMKYGPKLHCPLMAVTVNIRDILLGKGTSPTMISSAATQCIRKAIQNSETLLMEPIMHIEVVINGDHQSVVSSDLSRRRADILSIDDRHNQRIVQARVPLSELLGYSNQLRYITSGTATFSMEFVYYQAMSRDQEIAVIRKETGAF